MDNQKSQYESNMFSFIEMKITDRAGKLMKHHTMYKGRRSTHNNGRVKY
jgi:hypothetical protein